MSRRASTFVMAGPSRSKNGVASLVRPASDELIQMSNSGTRPIVLAARLRPRFAITTEQENNERKGGEAPKGAYHLPHQRVRRVLSGGRSPSGVSPRRLSRRSTARNSVQAALHAMKCEGVTSAWVIALKRSTSRLGRSTERVDARTARGQK